MRVSRESGSLDLVQDAVDPLLRDLARAAQQLVHAALDVDAHHAVVAVSHEISGEMLGDEREIDGTLGRLAAAIFLLLCE